MNKRTKYTVWAFWDKHDDPPFHDLYVTDREPIKSCGNEFFHLTGQSLVVFRSDKDKLAFFERVLSIRPGECKSFEVEVDEV